MHKDNVPMALGIDGPNQLPNYNVNYLYMALHTGLIMPGSANFEIWTKKSFGCVFN